MQVQPPVAIDGDATPPSLPLGSCEVMSDAEARRMSVRPDQPFYFTVVFWGEKHRRYFVDFVLASLLSPGNLPALDKQRRSKFLINTPRTDWDAIVGDPNMRLLAQTMDVEHVDLPPGPPDEGKMMTMSRGHKILSEMCFRDRAYGVFLTADVILSDGSVVSMQRLAMAGKCVVLAAAIRFSLDPMLDQMQREGFFRAGEPIVISPRDLVRIGLANLHTETLRYEFDAPWFTNLPYSVYWWVRGGKGIIIHTFSWAPLLVDYNAIHKHDTSTFDDWTLDGDYVHKNFGSSDAIHVVRDSDELMLVSFTRESEMHYDLANDTSTLKRLPVIGPRYKRLLVHGVYTSAIMDPLKREIFMAPTFFHWAPITPRWQAKERQIREHLLNAAGNLQMTGDFQHLSHIARIPHLPRNPMLFLLNGAMWEAIKLARARFTIRWHYQYRRFVWWKIKSKLGLVHGPADSSDPKWAWPAPGFANPIYTLRWLYVRVLYARANRVI